MGSDRSRWRGNGRRMCEERVLLSGALNPPWLTGQLVSLPTARTTTNRESGHLLARWFHHKSAAAVAE